MVSNLICGVCGGPRTMRSDARQLTCKSCDSRRAREHYKDNPEKNKAAVRKWEKEHPEWIKESKRKEFQRKKERITNEVLDAYGKKCACSGGCRETTKQFLTIDHINMNGAEHKKALGIRGGVPLYRWLKKNGFPKDNYRLLCFNCNSGRARNNGICPHEQVYALAERLREVV